MDIMINDIIIESVEFKESNIVEKYLDVKEGKDE